MIHIFYRSDFKNDADGHSYFDGLLGSMGFSDKKAEEIDTLEINVRNSDIIATDEDGNEITKD